MSEEREVEPCSSKEHKRARRVEEDKDQGRAEEESDGLIQDQILVAPETSQHLLDFQSLKQVRLVCKSWLLEATFHMEGRGIVVINERVASERIQEFLQVRQGKIPALPQPFQSVHVSLFSVSVSEPTAYQTARHWTYYSYCHNRNKLFPLHRFFTQLLSLCPPLALAGFVPGNVPLSVTLPLISQCSSTLEYLWLDPNSCEAKYLPVLDPKREFPKLKDLTVNSDSNRLNNNSRRKWLHFPAIIAWIAKASPHLEAYDIQWVMDAELSRRLLLGINIRSLKSLSFMLYPSDPLALEHYLSIPFPQLENLLIDIYSNDPVEKMRLSTVVVDHCASSLNSLGLSRFQEISEPTFPTCPMVKQLHLNSLVYTDNFLYQHFPSLETLHVDEEVRVEFKENWSSLTPLLGVKKLGVRILKGLRDRHLGRNRDIPEAVQFFEKFPNLEFLHRSSMLLMHCCGLKASGAPRFSNLLSGVKHVVLCKDEAHLADAPWNPGSSLAVLKGIETFEMAKFTPAVATMVGKELKDLKIFQFTWEAKNFHPDIKVLLEVASRVKKVIIKNGCSSSPFREPRDRRSQELLQEFYQSAPNAECECGTRHVLGL